MVQKTYNFTISKPTDKECLEAMTAASDLVKSLKHEDLLLLANAAKTKPHLIETARPFLK